MALSEKEHQRIAQESRTPSLGSRMRDDGTIKLSDAEWDEAVQFIMSKRKQKEASSLQSESTKEESALFCRMCGKKISADSKFCMYCGTKVEPA